LRRRLPDLPVVMLTALGEESDRVVGLEVGADDYVTKPFSPRELVLRVRSVLRRTVPKPDDKPIVLADDDLVADTGRRIATLGGQAQAWTRAQLLEQVWGWQFGDQSTVTVHVRRLREKIEADSADPRRLLTVWGVGYRYEPVAHA
jgi:DNA-binding response OmpR family regulator